MYSVHGSCAFLLLSGLFRRNCFSAGFLGLDAKVPVLALIVGLPKLEQLHHGPARRTRRDLATRLTSVRSRPPSVAQAESNPLFTLSDDPTCITSGTMSGDSARFSSSLVVHIRRHNLCAFYRKQPGDSASDSAARAGDDGSLTVQSHAFASCSLSSFPAPRIAAPIRSDRRAGGPARPQPGSDTD